MPSQRSQLLGELACLSRTIASKELSKKAAMTARLPLGYAQSHPYTGLKERARTATLDFLSEKMAEAITFGTPRELMAYALTLISLDGLIAKFGVNEGDTISYIGRQLSGRTVHGIDSFEGLPENWLGSKINAGYFNRHGKSPRVPVNVKLYAGWFEDSLPKFE